MGRLLPPELISRQSSATGANERKDAYDLTLWRLPGGGYRLVVHMKLQFFFVADQTPPWERAEKYQYVHDWQAIVKAVWNQRSVAKFGPTQHLDIEFTFSTQIGGFMFDHWEITVTKLAAGDQKTSYVERTVANVHLDSYDLEFRSKRGATRQIAAAHEFGHMLGLAHEYKGRLVHRYKSDRESVMHSGMALRQRHFAHLVSLAESRVSQGLAG